MRIIPILIVILLFIQSCEQECIGRKYFRVPSDICGDIVGIAFYDTYGNNLIDSGKMDTLNLKIVDVYGNRIGHQIVQSELGRAIRVKLGKNSTYCDKVYSYYERVNGMYDNAIVLKYNYIFFIYSGGVVDTFAIEIDEEFQMADANCRYYYNLIAGLKYKHPYSKSFYLIGYDIFHTPVKVIKY